jgi:hypothetical protein
MLLLMLQMLLLMLLLLVVVVEARHCHSARQKMLLSLHLLPSPPPSFPPHPPLPAMRTRPVASWSCARSLRADDVVAAGAVAAGLAADVVVDVPVAGDPDPHQSFSCGE